MKSTHFLFAAARTVALTLTVVSWTSVQAAENAVTLESFENGIDSVAANSWGGRGTTGDCTWSSYSKAGPDDTRVTDGEKSLKVEIRNTEGWSSDFQVALSSAASKKVTDALASKDVARYILRYDLIFPTVEGDGPASWITAPCYLGSWGEQVEADGSRTNRTMSIPLDLLTDVTLEGENSDRVVLRFIDDFDAVEDPFVGPLELYLDNLRLVDTYAPGAVPVTAVLQSFEQDLGGVADFTDWGGTPRTQYSQYTATGPDDIRVTDGTRALQVDYSGTGDWQADFQVPLAGTQLADLLKLDAPVEERPAREQLARYTLRFDVTFAAQIEGVPSWLGLTAHTVSEDFIYSIGRPDGADLGRKTYSIPLDQIGWSDTAQGMPVIMLIANGDWGDRGTTLWFDDFRLIDTGNVIPPASFKINSLTRDAANGQWTLSWESQPGKSYRVKSSNDLKNWSDLATNVAAGTGGTTSHVFSGNAAALFLQVLRN
jgi:hypothetical protein